MSKRVNDIVQKLGAQTEEGIYQGLDQISSIDDFSIDEKNALSDALISIFYQFPELDPTTILRIAVHIEWKIAGFGEDVIPYLFNEIIEADGETLAYIGKAYSKIGKKGVDYMLSQWDHFRDDDITLINLTQTLANYKLIDVKEAVPYILNANVRDNHHLSSMSLCTIGKLIEKSSRKNISRDMVNEVFDYAFSFLSNPKPLVRRMAVHALGNMCLKKVLPVNLENKVYNAFLAIIGKDGHYNWDSAFIVRREAEDYMEYINASPRTTEEYEQSFLILSKRFLCENTYHYVVEAPYIARKIEAGQFVIIRPYISSERIPFSISGWDRSKGTIDIIVSAVGKTSTEINRMEVGDVFKDVVGPLGERSHLPKTIGISVVIGGGYGIGAIVPTAKDLKADGNKVYGIVGARTKDSLIMVDELSAVCDEVIITTNDGSLGVKGMVTTALDELMQKESLNHVLAVGPVPMMKAVSDMTEPLKIETFVSLNAIMVDGTGMCGACRVTIGNETKFACIHGPDFDGHHVDFDELMKRQQMFVKEEQIAFETMDDAKPENNG